MKAIFSWLIRITGVLPGIAVLLKGFRTPEELRIPFGIIAAASGYLAFGLVEIIYETVKLRDRRILAGLVFAFGFAALVSLCSYWMVLNQCEFSSPGRSSVFFPYWLSGRAEEDFSKAGGREAFYEKYGAGAVVKLLASQSNEMNGTRLLLLVLIVTGSIALSVASGLAARLKIGDSAPDNSLKTARDHRA